MLQTFCCAALGSQGVAEKLRRRMRHRSKTACTTSAEMPPSSSGVLPDASAWASAQVSPSTVDMVPKSELPQVSSRVGRGPVDDPLSTEWKSAPASVVSGSETACLTPPTSGKRPLSSEYFSRSACQVSSNRCSSSPVSSHKVLRAIRWVGAVFLPERGGGEGTDASAVLLDARPSGGRGECPSGTPRAAATTEGGEMVPRLRCAMPLSAGWD